MARVFLIRHGEPAHGWGDHADPGLSERGRAQADAAAEALCAARPQEIWSSPLARCRETAAPLAARLGASVRIEPAVAEVAAPSGVVDRVPWLRETFPAIVEDETRQTRWTELAPELQAWRARMIATLSAAPCDVAAFTHFIAINVLIGAALDKPETIVCRPAPGSIHELELSNGQLRLVALGAQVGTAMVL